MLPFFIIHFIRGSRRLLLFMLFTYLTLPGARGEREQAYSQACGILWGPGLWGSGASLACAANSARATFPRGCSIVRLGYGPFAAFPCLSRPRRTLPALPGRFLAFPSLTMPFEAFPSFSEPFRSFPGRSVSKLFLLISSSLLPPLILVAVRCGLLLPSCCVLLRLFPCRFLCSEHI